MLFFHIVLIIHCVYTAAFSSGTQSSAHQLPNPLEGSSIQVFVFLQFMNGEGDVCFINTRRQSQRDQVQEVWLKVMEGIEFYLETEPEGRGALGELSAAQAGGPECGAPAPIKRKDRLIAGAHWPTNELNWWALESVRDHG